ncbi:MAG: hypothetical protein GF401_14055 [Chitinivibrionales bacterium]|nr:hypothetical protein [Chitinivibrionales bacterium]
MNKIVAAIANECTENGVVAKISENYLVVHVNPGCSVSTACATCGKSSGCGQEKNPERITVPLQNPQQFSEGEHVRIRFYRLSRSFASLLVFGLPIAGLVAALVLWNSLLGLPVEGGGAVIVGIGGFLLGFAGAFIADKVIDSALPPPSIEGKYP